MFTGIVTDIGRVRKVKPTARDRRYEIETGWDTARLDLGASVSHAGCCLTVVETGPGWFAVEVSGETLDKTTLGGWTAARDEGSRTAAVHPCSPPSWKGYAVGSKRRPRRAGRRRSPCFTPKYTARKSAMSCPSPPKRWCMLSGCAAAS